MAITTIGRKGLDLIKQFEGFRAAPYLCPARVATIGYGTTFYENGVKVTMSDPPVTEERAEEILRYVLNDFEKKMASFIPANINQNQFDALLCFCYNVGATNTMSSTLLKKMKANPADPSIKDEFAKWNKGGGKVLPGLVKRREAEATLYFS